MKDDKLLIITSWFPSKGTSFSSPFVYSQVRELSKFFNHVQVISIIPYIPRKLRRKRLLKLLGMKNRWHQDIYSTHYGEDYDMGNMSVHYVKYTIPPKYIFHGIFLRLTLKKIRRFISSGRINFSLIHAHFLWLPGYIAAHLKEEYDVPLVVTGHGSDVYTIPFKNPEWMKKIRFVVDNADSIITVGRENKKILITDMGVPAEKVSVIPNGYDSKQFKIIDKEEARKALNILLDKKVLLTAGNLLPIKGHKYLIEAIGIVADHTDNILCIIAGSGALENDIKKQISNAGLDNYVKLVGGRPYREIPMWMNACDIFVLPSLRESFGVVQIEAMACGKPVVATINGGSEGIITDEGVGLLVKAGDPKELAEAIEKALETDWDSEYIRKFAEKYEWGRVAEEILSVYRESLR